MFAPNRLLTTKEQWLLVGFIVAVITGCATLYFHDASRSLGDDATTTIIRTKSQETEVSSAGVPVIVPVQTVSAQNEKPDAPPAAPSPHAPQTIGVAVMGAVVRPDLYMVDEDMRVSDLIALAGGVTEYADLSGILLTAPLVDETTLTIPELPTVTRDETQVAIRRRDTVALNPPMYRRSAPSVTTHAPAYTTSGTVPQVSTAAPSPSLSASSDGLLNINYASAEQLQQLPGIGPVFAERIITERERQPFMSVEELKRVPGIADKRLETIRPFITAP